MTSQKIESVLNETRRFSPPEHWTTANIPNRAAYDALVKEAEEDWEGFWRRQAEREN